MRNRLLTTLTLGAALALAPLAAPGAAYADPVTVTPDQCFSAGGYHGGYDSQGRAFCSGGPYHGIPFDRDPLQGWCPDGQHLGWRYLYGFVCVPNIPS